MYSWACFSHLSKLLSPRNDITVIFFLYSLLDILGIWKSETEIPLSCNFRPKKSSNLHQGNFLWYKMKFIWSLARCLLGSSSLLSLISKLELQLFDLITINIQPICAVNPRWTHLTITRRLAPLFIRVTLRPKLRSANYLHVKISCKKWMKI